MSRPPRQSLTKHPKSRSTATPKQIAANRKNARKSTGPRTVAGKERSRANGMKHGLTATVLRTEAEIDLLGPGVERPPGRVGRGLADREWLRGEAELMQLRIGRADAMAVQFTNPDALSDDFDVVPAPNLLNSRAPDVRIRAYRGKLRKRLDLCRDLLGDHPATEVRDARANPDRRPEDDQTPRASGAQRTL